MYNYKYQHPIKYRDHYPKIHVLLYWVCHYYGSRGHIRPNYYKL